jgi:hypothetical protein
VNINVQINAKALQVETDRQAKNLAFSTAQAINKTILDVQLDERANLDQKFKVRKPAFMYRLIRVYQFAKVQTNKPFAEIGIDNTKDRVLLSEFEAGGKKDPFIGKNVAVPITGSKARPSFGQSVPSRFMFKGLDMQRHLTGAGKTQWKGKYRTFVIPGVGIAMRGGAPKTERRVAAQERFKGLQEKTGTQLIYTFAKHPKLKPGLAFVVRAQRKIAVAFPDHFNRIFNAKRT